MSAARLLRSALLILVLATPGVAAQLRPVEIAVSLKEGASPAPITARLRAVPSTTGPQKTTIEPIDREIQIPGKLEIALDRSVVWEVSLEADGYWSPKGLVGPGDSDVAITLWTTGEIAGIVQVEKGEKIPADLTIRFESSPEPGKAQILPQQTVVCPIVEGAWACQVPAGKLDLRLRARSFVSHYRWGAIVPARGALKVGPLALRRGASIVGRVEVSEGAISPQGCRVELSPTTAGLSRSAEAKEQLGKLALSASVNERGFFHLEGVPPGSYVLTARQPGFAPAQIFPVSVFESSESEVRQPLILMKPLTLEVALDPALDPWSRPWEIQLFGHSAASGNLNDLGKGKASEEGLWTKPGLAPGEYSFHVVDSHGSSYAEQEIRLDRPSPPLQVKIPLVWVEGKVRIGEEPLAANLWFGGRHGKVSVLLRSDSDGEFSGALPREGDWEVDVDAAKPLVRRRFPQVAIRPLGDTGSAKVEIVLPDTKILGEVVQEDGAKVAKARVIAVELTTAYPTALETDAEGRFEVVGIPEGLLNLMADKAGSRSDEVAVQITEGATPPPVRLVLRKTQEISGTVVSSAGGVPGARVFALALSPSSSGFVPKGSQSTTDAQGRFQIEVASSAAEVQIVVLPPGFAASLQRLQGIPKGPLEIRVDPRGGTLTFRPVDLGKPEDPASARLIVLLNGAFVDESLLRMWAEINGVRNADPGQLVIPQLPAGTYTACWARLSDAMQIFRSGIPGSAACDSGSLSPGGELILEAPTPPL